MILEKIRQVYPQLTKSQKRLADFIATSYREAAFMTASRLAHRLALNEATVIRFAQRLGYSGYPGLIQDIQALVQDELLVGCAIPSADEAAGEFFTALNNEVESLQRAITHISPEVSCQTLAALRQAERIYVVGQGISASLAQLLATSLRALGFDAESPPADPLNMAMILAGINAQCAVVGVAVEAESLESARVLRYAAQKGARTMAFTWSPVSPVAQVAELAISCPATDLLPLPAMGVMATLIDAVVQSLALQDAERVKEHRESLAEACDFVLTRRRR